MEEIVKTKSAKRVKEKRPPHGQEGVNKRTNKHQGLLKNDLPELSPSQPGSPIKKLFVEVDKILRIGMEKDCALLEKDTAIQNSNETIDNLRKNMLHLQMEYEKLDQNLQKEISYRAEIVKRMDATGELVESVLQCSNVLAASIKQLEDDKLKITEFYELIYQNQKDVEGRHARTEKFLKEQDELFNAKFVEIKTFQKKILSQHVETISQLSRKLTHADDQLKMSTHENKKLEKKFQDCQESSDRLQSCLEQQEKLNHLLQGTVEQFKRNLKILKIQRFRCQKLLKNKKKQFLTVVSRNKSLKKSLDKAEILYGECLSANKILKSKNDEWRLEFEKHLSDDLSERESWESQRKQIIDNLKRREAEMGDLKAENKDLKEKISRVSSSEDAKQLELEKIQNELSKMLNENLNLKENVAKLSEENSEKEKTISQMEMKSAAAGADLNSQIEYYRNESRKLEEVVKKLESQLVELQERLTQERTENDARISDFNRKLEENLKTSRDRISNLEKLLEDSAACIKKLESEKTHVAKTAVDGLDKELQAEKSRNRELRRSLESEKTVREEVSRQLKAAENQISGYAENVRELKELNKALQSSRAEVERNSTDLKMELELGKKSFDDLEEKYKNAERELDKLQKMAEENAELKSSADDLKSLLDATEARLEAYKVAVKKLESEKVQTRNYHSEEMSRLKTELNRLEEAVRKGNRPPGTPKASLENSQSKRERETPNARARNNPIETPQKSNKKENDQEDNRILEKWRQISSTPVDGAKKRKILTSTPTFRSLTPLQKKRDPYEFDSDSSVEKIDPDKVLKVFSQQKKITKSKRPKINN